MHGKVMATHVEGFNPRHRSATTNVLYARRIKLNPGTFHCLKTIASVYQPLLSIFVAPNDNWLFEPMRLDVFAKLVKRPLQHHWELLGGGRTLELVAQAITHAPSVNR